MINYELIPLELIVINMIIILGGTLALYIVFRELRERGLIE